MLTPLLILYGCGTSTGGPERTGSNEAPGESLSGGDDGGGRADDIAFLRVNDDASWNDVWVEIARGGVEIVKVESVYTMGDHEWYTAVYTPDADSGEELEDLTRYWVDATWEDLLSRDYAPSDDELAQYDAAERHLAAGDQIGLRPFSLVLTGPTDQLVGVASALANDEGYVLASDVDAAKAQQEESEEGSDTGAAESGAAPPPSSSTPATEDWMPDSGSVTTADSSSSGYRTISQTLKWDSKSGFASSGSYSTYEHELFLDYSDGASYLSTSTTASPNCYPNISTSSQNFPSSAYAYLDTRVSATGSCPTYSSSGTNTVEFAFGLVYANKITAGSTYTVSMTIAKGSASSDKIRVQGELGFCDGSLLCGTTCALYYGSWSAYGIYAAIGAKLSGYAAGGCSGMLTWGVCAQGECGTTSVANQCVVPSKGTSDCSSWSSTVPGTISWTW